MHLRTNYDFKKTHRVRGAKRQKVQNLEVISLLSDEEENTDTSAAPQKKPASPKIQHLGPTGQPVQNYPTTLPPHKTLGDRAKRNAAEETAKQPSDVSTTKYMSAAKALAKSAIKQRSSVPPAPELPALHSTRAPAGPSSSLAMPSLPPSMVNPHNPYQAPSPYQTPTPPPSSSQEADPLSSSQAMASSQPTPMPKAPSGTIPEEPPLCPEQEHLVELIASGRNVFYTGSAGCGKSTVLKAFTKRLREMGKNVRIVAPTGRAALQVNGSTTWTFAGWTPDHHKRTLEELRTAAHGKYVWERFSKTEVLVIDEISMVENLHFERLNEVLKAARHKSYLPAQPAFGGVQLVVTGDFCQLPPVRPFQHCIQCGFSLVEKNTAAGKFHVCKRHGEYRDEDKWAFRSKAWEECNFVHVHLNTIHRQSDETFIRMLQKCRIGRELSPDETDLLMDHKCMVHHATRLFATRDEVGEVNRREFEKLKTINHTYWCLDEFIWQRAAHPHLGWKGMRKPAGPGQSEGPLRALEDSRYSECVQLKKGMLVVLLVNLDLEMGLCNGSQGIICGFEKNDPKKLPQAKVGKKEPENKIFGDRALMKEDRIKKFIESPGAKYKTWPIVKFHNGQVRTIYADCSIAELGDERPYSLLMRTQIPLAPAWAMTIHKSQSLTLDRVIVNLSKAFEEGQVYVALSRATGLHGLKIEGDKKGLLAGLGGNPEVQEFLREKFGDLDEPLSSGS